MGFKSNLEEKEAIYKYRKDEKRFVLILAISLSFVFSFIFGTMLADVSSYKTYLGRVPFMHETFWYDIFLLTITLLFSSWATGKPKFLQKLLHFHEGGKEEELRKFFYPTVSFSDGIPREFEFYYFKGKKIDAYTLFDFGEYSNTSDLISLFRDKTLEQLKEKLKNAKMMNDEKGIAKQKNILKEHYEMMSKNNGVGSEQEKQYLDIFHKLEGIYKGYKNDFGDKITIDEKMKSPLVLQQTKKSKRITFSIDEKIDVFRNGTVYFSIEQIQETAKGLTFLYMRFLKKRLSRGRFYNIAREEEQLKRFELFFKFFTIRWLLLNYSNLPSSWLCISIEDYTMRAISSEIDRPFINTIFKNKNDGNNKGYHSDIEAKQFLFTYWAFREEKKNKEVYDDIAFCFDATKAVTEQEARRVAKEASMKIATEWENTEVNDDIEDILVNITNNQEKGD